MDREQQLQHLPARERAAVTQALNAGARYGYGNVIAWLATEWAWKLRDEFRITEATAIAVVSNCQPYPLPPPATATKED